jgi:hypothetical protein
MKLFLLSSALLATLVAATDCSNTLCQDFGIHAGTTATFAAHFISEIQFNGAGKVGVSPGISITGKENVNFEEMGGSWATAEDSNAFAAGVNAAHANAMSIPGIMIDADIGGLIFGPGSYIAAGAMSISGANSVVTLDAGNNPDAVFLFQAGTTLTTAAGTDFNLINGAKASNVLFVIGSAATFGEKSMLMGSIMAGTAVTLGIEAAVWGCVIAKSAVTIEGGGGVFAQSELTFNSEGALEQCVDAAEDAPASSPTASHGDPHCKYQRFRFILLACRSFILLSCRIFVYSQDLEERAL